MALMLSVLQGFFLIVLALFALGFAKYVFSAGHGLVGWASIALLGRPSWIRWIILLPAIILSAFILIFTFNVIFWIGDLFGESFVGTAWMWGTTFTQAVVVPGTIVTTGYVIAPNGRRWIAGAVMLAIWAWLAGTLFDPETSEFLASEVDVWFYGWLVVAAGAAAYAAIKAWVMEPLLRLAELEMRDKFDAETQTTPVPPQTTAVAHCVECGGEISPDASFCDNCGTGRPHQRLR